MLKGSLTRQKTYLIVILRSQRKIIFIIDVFSFSQNKPGGFSAFLNIDVFPPAA